MSGTALDERLLLQTFVEGVPVPQGSARAFVVKGRAVVTSDNPNLKGWRYLMAMKFSAERHFREAATGGCSVSLMFWLPRPKGHVGVRGLKSSAPTAMVVKPDVDKLTRAVLDALTDAGVFRDDSQVVSVSAQKQYADPETPAGVSVSVWEVMR